MIYELALSDLIEPTKKVDAYATKYKECRLCGTEADCTYISQEDGLCQACRANEEYYEHERRVSGD